MASTWHAVHFVYSFTYLVLRTTVLSLYAATIYDQSKQPKTVLFCVPTESYCCEVSAQIFLHSIRTSFLVILVFSQVARLLNQIAFDELALTGCRFFSVTRTLVLTVHVHIILNYLARLLMVQKRKHSYIKFLTPNFPLQVAGTIVTYEIVLVQFNAFNVDTRKNTTFTCYNFK